MKTNSAEYPEDLPGKIGRRAIPRHPSGVLEPTAVLLIDRGLLAGIQIIPSVSDGFLKGLCLSEARSAGGVDASRGDRGAAPRSPRFEPLGRDNISIFGCVGGR
jgi:hypothetical protein